MLRMGLIGAGTMGQWYARTFAEYERSQLVAICDLNDAKAQALAGQWQAAAYTDYQAMLAREQLDAVAVATPDRFHRAPVVACLEAGKHVLCEKPLATTMEDALAIEAAAARAGREVMVNFGNRRRDRVQAARQAVLEQRQIGEITDAYVELNERIGKTDTLAWAAETSPVWFLLSHCVDTLRYVSGLEITEVKGYETRKLLAARGMPTSDTALFLADAEQWRPCLPRLELDLPRGLCPRYRLPPAPPGRQRAVRGADAPARHVAAHRPQSHPQLQLRLPGSPRPHEPLVDRLDLLLRGLHPGRRAPHARHRRRRGLLARAPGDGRGGAYRPGVPRGLTSPPRPSPKEGGEPEQTSPPAPLLKCEGRLGLGSPPAPLPL